ncbi:50S ribosomal protein L30e-like protein [Chytridium lagenaria]|nr:50S ribosomal protein L30e-like protein [Chytridium lagenaria]
MAKTDKALKKKKVAKEESDAEEAPATTTSTAMDVDEDGKGKKEAIPYEVRIQSVSQIAHPLASKKLTKKVLKTIRKASKAKSVKRGVKEVVKGLKKGSKGVVIIAGDISPIDVITHVPVLCEESDVPYIYVPSKEDLGTAGATKRPTSVIMLLNKNISDFEEAYGEVLEEVKGLNEKLITTI